MKFLLDESADYPLAIILRVLGHDVKAIAHDYPNALRDQEVLSIAREEQRILISNDRDFGELIFRRKSPHAGVILFRLADEALETKSTWLRHVLENHASELQHFVVVTERGVRALCGNFRCRLLERMCDEKRYELEALMQMASLPAVRLDEARHSCSRFPTR